MCRGNVSHVFSHFIFISSNLSQSMPLHPPPPPLCLVLLLLHIFLTPHIHSHTHIHTHTYVYTHTHTHTLSLFPSHTHTHTLSLSLLLTNLQHEFAKYFLSFKTTPPFLSSNWNSHETKARPCVAPALESECGGNASSRAGALGPLVPVGGDSSLSIQESPLDKTSSMKEGMTTCTQSFPSGMTSSRLTAQPIPVCFASATTTTMSLSASKPPPLLPLYPGRLQESGPPKERGPTLLQNILDKSCTSASQADNVQKGSQTKPPDNYTPSSASASNMRSSSLSKPIQALSNDTSAMQCPDDLSSHQLLLPTNTFSLHSRDSSRDLQERGEKEISCTNIAVDSGVDVVRKREAGGGESQSMKRVDSSTTIAKTVTVSEENARLSLNSSFGNERHSSDAQASSLGPIVLLFKEDNKRERNRERLFVCVYVCVCVYYSFAICRCALLWYILNLLLTLSDTSLSLSLTHFLSRLPP